MIVTYFDKLFSGTLAVSDLFAQYNEHRIFFPQIAMLLLGIATKYNNVAEMYFMQACFIVALVALMLAFRASTTGTKYKLFLFAPVSFLLFSPRQYDNTLWGFQMAFVFALVFGVLAFYFLYVSGARNFRKLAFLAALVTGTVATFSCAPGLFVWPAGLLQLFIAPIERSAKRAMIGIWSSVALVEGIVYFHDWTRSADSSPLSYGFDHPTVGIEFFLALLGGSLFWEQDFAFAGGLVLACLAVISLFLIYKDRKLGEYSFWVALLLFSFLVLAFITIGRVGAGIEQAVFSRYTTFSILATIGIYVIGVYAIPTLAFQRRWLGFALLGTLYGILLLSLPGSYAKGVNAGEETKASREKLAFILFTYDSQPNALLQGPSPFHPLSLFPEYGVVREDAPVLERLGYNVFSGLPARVSLPPLSALSSIPSSTRSNIDSIDDIQPGQQEQNAFVTVTGWAIDAKAKDTAGGVYVDIDGKRFPAFYGTDRQDVADNFDAPLYRWSGFDLTIPTPEIGPGPHKLSIIVLTNDKVGYYGPDQETAFEVQ